MEESGYAMVAGVRMPIYGVHMCQGRIALRVLVPGGFPGCIDALVTIFGHDNCGIMQIEQEVEIPAVSQGRFAVMELVLGTTE